MIILFGAMLLCCVDVTKKKSYW